MLKLTLPKMSYQIKRNDNALQPVPTGRQQIEKSHSSCI